MSDSATLETLIAQTALGKRKAFDRLYDLTSAKLFGVCLRVLNNKAEAEDVLQEVYITIWQKAGRYGVTGHSPMTWLITIARNRSIDLLRKRRDMAGAEVLDKLVAKEPTPEAALLRSSENSQLQGCIDQLQDAKADAIRGAYLNGDSYQDLASRHDVPLNTMRTWLRRSLIKLKECLGK